MKVKTLTGGITLCKLCLLVSISPTLCSANEATSHMVLPIVKYLEVNNSRWFVTGTTTTVDQAVTLAVLENSDTDATIVVRVGDWISEDVRVDEVDRDAITIFTDGKQFSMRVNPGRREMYDQNRNTSFANTINQKSPFLFKITYDNFRKMLSAMPKHSSKDSVVQAYNNTNDGLLQIKAVDPVGVLHRLGLEAGDVIIAMQGEGIEGHMHAKKVLDHIKPDSVLKIVYRRSKAIRQMSIEVTAN